ncbi:atherin-like isoform X2 [Choloepus didactylus]|uniref:atherin-like isoform X2 n=1 Tax=Choloepus didactylus TaxID=27675 RepID=UPI00189E49BA|nr:atherin-like isoform X2 [Choloepus didactylus]XP_037669244.1 atherin-like isoform X2 [Choloepus didactylus]XP_037669245.1 atherin-like isoform X2 [Choloepus didactylus]
MASPRAPTPYAMRVCGPPGAPPRPQPGRVREGHPALTCVTRPHAAPAADPALDRQRRPGSPLRPAHRLFLPRGPPAATAAAEVAGLRRGTAEHPGSRCQHADVSAGPPPAR